MTKLEYDILTVQPMYLYPDDIDYLRKYQPQVLKNTNTPAHPNSYIIPPPSSTSDEILDFMVGNGWTLVKDECRTEASRFVCDYRKEKYLPLLNNNEFLDEGHPYK